MSRPMLLLVPEALRRVADPSVFERMFSMWMPTRRKDGRFAITRSIGITGAETEATIAMLADGGYRPARQPPFGGDGMHEMLVETVGTRLRRIGRGLASAIASGGPERGPRHASEIAWSMMITDETQPGIFKDPDTLARAGKAMADARVVEEATLMRLDGMVAAVAATHIGDGEGISMILPTPWSDACVRTGPGSMWANGPGAWRRVQLDPHVEAAIPMVMIVDSEPSTNGRAARIVMRCVERTTKRSDSIGTMDALRIMAKLERDPLR
jgi:hypothetical protein